jgi:putative ABC transport system permease protein
VRFAENLRLAAGAVAATRGRSALTVLSITIGAFAIVVMSSLAESGLATMAHGLEELGGARLLMVIQKSPERGEAKQAAYARGLTLPDRERIFRDLPHVQGLSMFSRLGKKEVLAESGARATTHVVAADARFFDVFHMRVARGRAFTEDENRGRAALCVVGHELAAELGSEDPLGRFLSVGPLRCRIAGVLADNDRFGVGFGFDWTHLVIVPSETLSDLDPAVKERASVLVQTDDPSSNEAVKRLVNARLVARHPGLDDFTLLDFSGVMQRFGAVFAAMELIVALLAGIALLIGGVGVMNMMLVAVSERVKEIGIRKALGARPREIGAQFLAEAVLLAVVGGGAGVVSGLGVAALAALLIARFVTSWQASFAPSATLTALVVSIGIGVLFGWLPARQAAKLDPIHAMRR